MAVTRLIRLTGALALTAGCLAGPAAYAVPSPASTCTSGAKSDFNGDGYDDVVIGDPSAIDGDRVAAGAVRVLYGGRGGIGSGGATTLTPDSPGVAAPAGPGASSGDGFGWSVATAHIDADPCLDLVIGAPWREVGGKTDVGAVYVVYGSPRGLGHGRAGTVLTPDAWGGSEPNSLFGHALAAADAHGPERSAVAIGAPYTDRKGLKNAGAAYTMWFTRDGTPQVRKRFTEDSPATVEGAKENGLFGWSVALPSLYGDPARRDLAVGAPRDAGAGLRGQPGAVVLYADASGNAPPVNSLGPPQVGVPGTGSVRIGFSLAYVESGGTHYLAVGLPGAEVDGKRNAGAVAVFRSDGRDYARMAFDDAPVVTEHAEGSTTAVEPNDQYGRAVALGIDRAGRVLLAVGSPFETSRVRHDGAVQIVPITGGTRARDLNQAQQGVPGAPAESSHFGWSLHFTGPTLLTGAPDDREHPTGSVIVTPPQGPSHQLLPPGTPPSIDFGWAL